MLATMQPARFTESSSNGWMQFVQVMTAEDRSLNTCLNVSLGTPPFQKLMGTFNEDF